MPSITTPTTQKLSIDPYTSKLFDFDNASSRVYLARSINNLLRTFGTDVVLENLYITSMSYDLESEEVRIVIAPGKCIIDTTLIEFLEPTELAINVAGYDPAGSLLLFVSFRFTESVHENKAVFKLIYTNPTNKFTHPEQIETNMDRICLAQFKFNPDNQTVDQATNKTITVGSIYYEVYPLNNIAKSVRDYVKVLFS